MSKSAKFGIERSGKSKAIIVLGMHRSGTSALMRTINLCGVDLGSNLMPPVANNNEKGFWENNDIYQINAKLLEDLNTSWDDVRSLYHDQWDIDIKERYRKDILGILKRDFYDSRFWGVKDPRLCRLLPLWHSILEHFGSKPYFIIIVRNPLEVVASLTKRDGFSKEKSCLLWLKHLLYSEKETRNSSRIFVTYEELLSDWNGLMSRVQNSLRFRWPVTLKDAGPEITAFLDKEMRHNRTTKNALIEDKNLSKWIREAYFAITDNISGENTKIIESMDAIEAELKEGAMLYEPELSNVLGKCRHLKFVLDNSDKTAKKLTTLLALRDKEVKDLNRQIELKIEEINDLSNQMIEREEAVEGLEIQLFERDEAVKGLRAQLAERDEAVKGLSAQLAERDEAAYVLETKFKQQNEEKDCLKTEIVALRQSRSWKITTPLRWCSMTARKSVRDARSVTVYILRLIYHRLPISTYRKKQMQNWCYTKISFLFRHTLSYKLWDSCQKFVLPQGGILSHVRLEHKQVISTTDSSNAQVSIIIPAYGEIEYTQRCLRSIMQTQARSNYEVIVIDNCSIDEKREVLAGNDGVRVVRNEGNFSLNRLYNLGADVSRGEYLLFLNNDIEVLHGWLDELLDTFIEFPDAGLVGPKIIYPNGLLKSASGVIFNDASTLHYGRNDDPNKPEYCYSREVDYSSRPIMIPKNIFNAVGGFNETFKSGCYVDANLAFAVRAIGRKILYQPLSQVVHIKNAECPTEKDYDVKVHQKKDRQNFYEMWKSVVVNHGEPGNDLYRGKDSALHKRILIIDSLTPTPDQDSGSLDSLFYMKNLKSLSFDVTFIPAANLRIEEKYTHALQRIGIKCLYLPYVIDVSNYLKIYGRTYDIVILYRVHCANAYIDKVRAHCPNAKIIFDTVDLHYLREQRQAQIEKSDELARQAEKTRSIEFSVIKKSDCTIVLSNTEKEILQKERFIKKKHIAVIPLIREIPGTKTPFEDRRDILFIGGYKHKPNVDAVFFFIEHIWTLVKRMIPELRFYIFGSNVPQEIMDLSSTDIIVTGYIEEISEYFDRCRLSIAPLRYGAGMKGKVGASLACGLPCVASTIAVEGMGLKEREEIIIADTPMEFAKGITEVYSDVNLWNQLSINGLSFAKKNYSIEEGKKRLKDLLRELGALGERAIN